MGNQQTVATQHNMTRMHTTLQRLFGQRTCFLLVTVIVLERFVAFITNDTNGWLHNIHIILLIISISLAVGLLIRSLVDLLVATKRLLPTITHLFRSWLGLRSTQAPETYVRDLFDDYADHFEAHLAGELDYQTPRHLLSILQANIDLTQCSHIIDLGCGTGLCARHFASSYTELVGIDLSEQMLLQAKRNGLYQRLICDSLTNLDHYYSNHFDCALSADVLVYFGELDSVFESVATILKSTGYFAFSVEACEHYPWKLNPGGRYAHSRRYLKEIAETFGFTVIDVQTQTLRTQGNRPVIGEIYLLKITNTYSS